jgi:hypothetical protein
MGKDDDRVELSRLIKSLRSELTKAQKEGEGQDLRFTVDSIELELQVTTTGKDGGEVGVKFWVFNASGKVDVSEASMQKMKLSMKLAESKGGSTPQINDETEKPI